MNVAVESNTVKYDSVPAFHPLLICHADSDPVPSKLRNGLELIRVVNSDCRISNLEIGSETTEGLVDRELILNVTSFAGERPPSAVPKTVTISPTA